MMMRLPGTTTVGYLSSSSFLFLSVLILSSSWVVHADEKTFDCPMRALAMNFAQQIQPFRPKSSFVELAAALEGSATSQPCSVPVPDVDPNIQWPPVFSSDASNGATYYVDASSGSDSNSGTLQSPFKTIQKAVSVARSGPHPATVSLRKGTYYLQSPILLGPADSNLTFQAYNAEQVWISGGTPLKNLQWAVHKPSSSAWVVEPDVSLVYGARPGDAGVGFINKTADWAACQTLCEANSTCTAWTWHDNTTGSYADDCYFRWDHELPRSPETGHISGFYQTSPTIYVADLSSTGVKSIPGLRQNGQRLIRARFPNANPEYGFGSNLMAKSWLAPQTPPEPAAEYNPLTPRRNNSFGFNTYQLGIGGCCENFTPSAGYWCGNATSGGGAFTYRIPSGMVLDSDTLPNMPASGYKNVDKAVIQTWRPSHWSSWMFAVGSYDSSSMAFKFSKGGFQGARGSNSGDNFYIENVLEELDVVDEWYFDEDSQQLYLAYNGTGAPSSYIDFVATNIKVLFNITGDSMDNPVRGISFQGVSFRDTAYTYLDPHGMPSGGDWGLQRTAAMFLERTEDVSFEACTFVRLDGNAIMLSAYNRGAVIDSCEFAWNGDTAIASWGNTKSSPVPGMGYDGTDGDQPRGSVIKNNFVHELGIWEKQSAFYFQAKTAQALLANNIFFNGPRAAINFNDGFGGGGNITYNFITNICRESGDHGPFNSWDRQMYLTDVRDGTPSVYKAFDDISHNFMIANYESQEAIDNDDGSCYYHTHDNFFVYSGNGMKSDFGGHSNYHHDNTYAFVSKGFSIVPQDPGYADWFYNNHVIMTQDGNYGNPVCAATPTEAKTVVFNNTIYTPTGKATECGMSVQSWVAKGNDKGTTVQPVPSDDTILGLARAALNMKN